MKCKSGCLGRRRLAVTDPLKLAEELESDDARANQCPRCWECCTCCADPSFRHLLAAALRLAEADDALVLSENRLRDALAACNERRIAERIWIEGDWEFGIDTERWSGWPEYASLVAAQDANERAFADMANARAAYRAAREGK